MKRTLAGLAAVVGAAVILAGCSVRVDVNGDRTDVEVKGPSVEIKVPAGEPGTVPVEVAVPGGARVLDLRIYQAVGEIQLDGGGSTAVSGVAGYWRNPPAISHGLTGDRLTVNITGERVTNVNGRVPDTVLHVGGGLPTRLEVEAGVGAMTLDLTRLSAESVRIKAGVGETRVKVPATANVRIWQKTGVGSHNLREAGFTREGDAWVSPGFRAVNVLEIHVETGVGALHVER